ncbi:hypothetical protein FZEAL_2621 [Fusarium zealandicum]|uniref:Alpha/beta hydrolase fold-3 domain-containing protein n=1 Tax=Fusarium zealandicum TaxID=1053134 RepID=A0A8H4UQG7_9HYPO|nr:hypothetical protein FZEAL_2621 [Fusarium zealandicum]
MEVGLAVYGASQILIRLNKLTTDPENPNSFLVLSFQAQQAQRIKEIQELLLGLLEEKEGQRQGIPGPSPSTRSADDINKDVDKWLHNYDVEANALRNHKTLSQEAEPDRQLLNPGKAMMLYTFFFARESYNRARKILAERRKLESHPGWEDSFLELNQETRIKKDRRNAYLERLWMGIFGGLALIGPMILMSLRPDLVTGLATASMATVIFVLVLTVLGTGLAGKDVLAATAAYAAVLVLPIVAMVTTKDTPEYVPIDPGFKPLPKYGHLSELDPGFAIAKDAIDQLLDQWWQPSVSLEDFRKLWQANQIAPEGCPVEGEHVLTETQQIPMRDGALVEIKTYAAKEKKPGSALVMRLHGGGWVVGGHCTEHAENLVIAGRTNSVVVSVDYRMAPEFRFPYASKANAASLGADSEKIILIGGSAGGNLAAVVSLLARDEGISGIVSQILCFPATCHPKFLPTDKYEIGSPKQNYNASVVNAVRLEWFVDHYMPEPTPDWRFSCLLAPSLKELPPALVLVAGFDVLRDEGIAYAERLKEEGVETELHTYKGVPHCFWMLSTHPKTVDYYERIVKYIDRFTG